MLDFLENAKNAKKQIRQSSVLPGGVFGRHFGKHLWHIHICIYRADGCDVPLCVYLALIALTTHKWGASDTGAKHMAPLCTRTPTAPPVGGARPSSGGAHRAEQQANEQQTVPLCARTPVSHLSVGTPKLGRHTSDQATRHQAVHARTPTPPPFGGGRPSYKATCTAGQRQRHERPRVGVMRRG